MHTDPHTKKFIRNFHGAQARFSDGNWPTFFLFLHCPVLLEKQEKRCRPLALLTVIIDWHLVFAVASNISVGDFYGRRLGKSQALFHGKQCRTGLFCRGPLAMCQLWCLAAGVHRGPQHVQPPQPRPQKDALCVYLECNRWIR